MGKSPGRWVHERTFGDRRRDFWWRLDEHEALRLLLVRTVRGRKRQFERAFSADELGKLLRFMADDGWHPTAGNATTVLHRPPPDGISTFIHRGLERSSGDAMLATQLAVVFTQAGLWEWNRHHPGMRFRQVAGELGRLAAYFERRQADRGPAPPLPKDVPRIRQPQAARPPGEPPGSPPPGFDYVAVCRGRAAELRGRLEAVSGGRHGGSKGQRREAALRDFLARTLPDPYAVGGGEVAAYWGEMSRQIDILIYDRRARRLAAEGDSLILPVESVYAAIEVKPHLTSPVLHEAMSNLRSAKTLRAQKFQGPPIFTAVLAWESIDPELLAQKIRDGQGETSPPLWVDCVCVLGKAVVHRHAGVPGPARWTRDALDGDTPYSCVELGDDALLYFELLLDDALRVATVELPDLGFYAQGLRFPRPKLF